VIPAKGLLRSQPQQGGFERTVPLRGDQDGGSSAGRGPRLPGRYGVIAMAAGSFPALIAVSAVLVAVRIGVTVAEPLLAT
jgi:hypothetical protein